MKVKFAILGCGHIGKRHAELVLQHPHAELVATIDTLDEISLQIAEYSPLHFNSLEDFLNANIEVDVINICTPNGLHAPQAIKCLEQGKHVVIEKPIALHNHDAQAILQAVQGSGKHVFPVMQNRYSSTVAWLKQIVSGGCLGEIYMVHLNCFWNRDERYYTCGSWHGTLDLDGGALYTQFSHFIDVLHWIFGDITNIHAKFSNFNHQHNTEFEDSGIVSFDLVDGGVGSITYSTSIYQSNFESSITVIAENGTIKIGGQYMNYVEYCHVEGTASPTLSDHHTVNNYGTYTGSASNHQFVIDNVIKTVKGKEEPHVSLADGLKVVDIINRIYLGRKPQRDGIKMKQRSISTT